MRQNQPKQPTTIRFKNAFPSFYYWDKALKLFGIDSEESIYNRLYARFNNFQLKWWDITEVRTNCALAYENAYNRYLKYKQVYEQYTQVDDILSGTSTGVSTQYRGDNKREGEENQVNMVAQKVGQQQSSKQSILSAFPAFLSMLENQTTPLNYLCEQFIRDVALPYQEGVRTYYA